MMHTGLHCTPSLLDIARAMLDDRSIPDCLGAVRVRPLWATLLARWAQRRGWRLLAQVARMAVRVEVVGG